MALEYLWAGSPRRRPARASVRNRFDTGSRQSRHAGMPLRYLWVGSPCRRPARRPLRHAEMSLEYLWAGFPCRRPASASVRNRFDTGSRQSCHARMPLRHLWARSPCQRADLELNPNLDVHEKGSNHGQTPAPNLYIHEIGSNHGQTRLESPNPSLNSTIFIILAKIGRFDESATSGVRSLQPEGIRPETVARCIGLPIEEVKALPEKV